MSLSRNLGLYKSEQWSVTCAEWAPFGSKQYEIGIRDYVVNPFGDSSFTLVQSDLIRSHNIEALGFVIKRMLEAGIDPQTIQNIFNGADHAEYDKRGDE